MMKSFTIALTVLALAAHAHGAVWSDDFNDGNAGDGVPVTWTPHPATPGTYDASSGDYVLTPLDVGNDDESMLATVESSSLGDTSIRTQGMVDGGGGNLGVAARVTFATLSGYTGLLDSGGNLLLIRFDGGAPSVLGATVLDINAADDAIVQLDVIGTDLGLRAWRPGDAMPAAPQVAVVDATVAVHGSAGSREGIG